MLTDSALRLVGQLKRHGRVKDHILNCVIPGPGRRYDRVITKMMNTPVDRCSWSLECVDPSRIVSGQRVLSRRKLRWHIRNFDRLQRRAGRVKLRPDDVPESDVVPIVVEHAGKLWMWNGNHRATSAILLGRNLWVIVFRAK